MAQSYPPPTQIVQVVQPQAMFSDAPMQVTCGNCHNMVMTTTIKESGAFTWIAVLILLVVCCPCFWIPFCVDSCKDVHHQCPSCGVSLGAYKRC